MADQFSELQDKIRLLGALLGDTIREAEGKDLFSKVENIRRQSKSARAGNTEDSDKLTRELKQLAVDELTPVARAFSHFLNLANLAEQHQTVTAVAQDRDPLTHLERVYADLKNSGLPEATIGEAVARLKIELVLTAHPTEITRRSLIHKFREMSICLAQLDDPRLTASMGEEVTTRLKELIVQVWHTDEIRKIRPTPIDEARWGMAVVENSLWEAVPKFLWQLDQIQRKEVGRSLPIEASPVRFVSWMGGDRDGNPNVTAEVTRRVILLSSWKAAELYLKDVQTLLQELSMSECNDTVRAMAGDAAEPYRAVLHDLKRRLENTMVARDAELRGKSIKEDEIIQRRSDLWDPIYACYQSLKENRMGAVADGLVSTFLRRIRCFGTSLVRLDIRQESGRHQQVFAELTRYLELGDYAEWSEQKKQEFLLRELQSKRPLIPHNWQPSPETQEVLDTCKVIAAQPREVLGAYVISMARVPSDVLAVKLLLKEADCSFSMPVAPLFETLDDLNNSGDVINSLLSVDWYRQDTGNRQMVMIGYSDSAKDAGAMAASWAQYRAQENLIRVCDNHDVELTLFHGRGGTIGRGGAPAHAALLSQPPGTLRTGLRVTEQGETIRVKLGMPDLAINTFNLYTSAILEANLRPPPEPKPEWRQMMDKLSESSCKQFRSVVYENPNFTPYFRAATPESELGKLPLGSRPAKRRPQGGIESLRAIPWIFAWTQNRLMLPAWLGAGMALREVVQEGGKGELEAMCREWPFFSTRLGMLEMVYAKTDIGVARYYDKRLVPENLWPLGQALRDQLASDIDVILDITNDGHLMADHRWAQQAVQMRSIYTDPLNVLQAELLIRVRQNPEPEVQRALLATVAGIAAGMRNTG